MIPIPTDISISKTFVITSSILDVSRIYILSLVQAFYFPSTYCELSSYISDLKKYICLIEIYR